MHRDVLLPPGWFDDLTQDETVALLRHLHDLAHENHPEEPQGGAH